MNSSIAAIQPGLAGSPPPTAGSVSAITARMDRLPTTRHLWILVLLISLGGFFEIYDLIFTGYIAPGMAKSGMLATTTATFFGFKGIGGFIAATFAGLFVGTFGLGFLPDRYGRRSVFTFSLLWYCIGSAIMAFQSTGEGIVLWRFITGIGVGIEIVTIDSYITELVPQHMRGRAMAFNQAVMFAAAPVAAILSYFLVPIAPYGSTAGAGWCCSDRSEQSWSGSFAARSRKARAGSRSTDAPRRPIVSCGRSRRKWLCSTARLCLRRCRPSQQPSPPPCRSARSGSHRIALA